MEETGNQTLANFTELCSRFPDMEEHFGLCNGSIEVRVYIFLFLFDRLHNDGFVSFLDAQLHTDNERFYPFLEI